LNSLHRQPNFLGELYLGVFLQQLQIERYSIFVVVGEFPRVIREPSDPNWTLVQNQPQTKGNIKTEEDDITAAIAASLKGTNGHPTIESDELQAAIRASLHDSGLTGIPMGIDVDVDLEAALLLSMESPSAAPPKTDKKLPSEPEEDDKDCAKIMVRLVNGSKVERRFFLHDKLEDVFNWLDLNHNVDVSGGRFCLVSNHPRKEYKEGYKSLKELGLVGSNLLTVVGCE